MKQRLWGRTTGTLTLFVALWSLTSAAARQDEAPQEPKRGSLPLAKDLTRNVRARLLAAKVSENRGQSLEVQFVTLPAGKEAAKEFSVWFPAHSHTTLERTLMNVIRDCVDWKAVEDVHQWHKAVVPATFSMPEGFEGKGTDFSNWFLDSLNLPKK